MTLQFLGCIECTVYVMWFIDPTACTRGLSVVQLCCAKIAEWIKVLFGVETLGDERHIVLDHHPDHRTGRMSGGTLLVIKCSNIAVIQGSIR